MAVLRAAPDVRAIARENRAFLQRAVRFLVGEADIRQVIDIGTGIPAAGNVHEVAQQIAPDVRVAYVDNDPIVHVHACALLTGEGNTSIVLGDLRQPEAIVDHPGVRRLIDFGQPVALLLVAILHFITDDEAPPRGLPPARLPRSRLTRRSSRSASRTPPPPGPPCASQPTSASACWAPTHKQHGRALSAKTADRFAALPWRATDDGAIMIDGASAWLDCSIEREIPVGDHDIVLLRIHALGSTVPPLGISRQPVPSPRRLTRTVTVGALATPHRAPPATARPAPRATSPCSPAVVNPES